MARKTLDVKWETIHSKKCSENFYVTIKRNKKQIKITLTKGEVITNHGW